jgi:hypothetical protein
MVANDDPQLDDDDDVDDVDMQEAMKPKKKVRKRGRKKDEVQRLAASVFLFCFRTPIALF